MLLPGSAGSANEIFGTDRADRRTKSLEAFFNANRLLT